MVEAERVEQRVRIEMEREAKLKAAQAADEARRRCDELERELIEEAERVAGEAGEAARREALR